MAVERLVGEKEDLISAVSVLKEEREELRKQVRGQSELIEDLKTRIRALNIKVRVSRSVSPVLMAVQKYQYYANGRFIF